MKTAFVSYDQICKNREIVASLMVDNSHMRRRKLSPLEERVLSRMIKAATGTGHKATAAKLRTVRAQLRTQQPDRADNPRLYAVATVLAELARLQADRARAARILDRCARS